MFGNTLKTLMIGGKVVALGTLLGTTTLAQTATDTVVVPEAALEEDSSIGTIGDTAPRSMEQMDNDQAIAETLIAQGFEDVYILREGPIMTITANRAGEDIELVYSVANGSLISINGEEIEEETTADETAGNADSTPEATADNETDSGAPDDGATDGDGTGGDGTGGEAGGDAGNDAGPDAGGDAGSDTGGDTGGDAGSDTGGDAGSDTGGEAGGDTGGDAGGDSGGDTGGESDGGSDTNG